jgi:lysophospholipase L1-like esterase
MLKKNQSVLFIGDSITDAGRTRPVGWPGGLGTGYVNVLHGLLYALHPALRINVLNTGISGNTVLDLKGRWQEDMLGLRPDWLSVMIGINDVWRQFDRPLLNEGVALEVYESTLHELLKRTRPKLQGLVLMTPFYIDPDPREPMRACMDEYGVVVRKAAKEFDAVFVDTQAAFNEALAFGHSSEIAWDRVHPGIGGHTVIAVAWLRAMGLLE